MPEAAVSRLCRVGRLEAISYLLLLAVAMPLKYLGDMPVATKLVGWPHGLLFIAYCLMVADAYRRHALPRGLVLALWIGALLPFGPFVVERRLLSHARAAEVRESVNHAG